jgi:hypothetical protein
MKTLPGRVGEEVFEGTWEPMDQDPRSHFKITELAIVLIERVRPRFLLDVAPDVEAE